MNLILDTSTENLVVILENNGDCDVSSCPAQVKHQEFLLPEIERILEKNKVTLENIDTIGVVVGPGSFTGVRLAVATAKAFCYVYKKIKLVGINMLDFLNFVCSKMCNENYLVLIKCTATKCYVGERKNGDFEKYILENDKLSVFKSKKLFALNLDKVGNIETEKIVLSPKDYVDYFKSRCEAGDFTDCNSLSIAYMALSQAEENLKNAKNN